MAIKLKTGLQLRRGSLEYVAIGRINHLDFVGRQLSVTYLLWEDEAAKKVEGMHAAQAVTLEWSDANPGLPPFPIDDSKPIRPQLYDAFKDFPAQLEVLADAAETRGMSKNKTLEQLHAKYHNITKGEYEDA